MQLSFRTPIWLYPVPVDFRKQIDGLVIVISDELKRQPTSGELFIFCNRRCNKIKLLWYDHNGFWLCYKRLEAGRLIFPRVENQAIELTRDQLSWLLSGLDFREQKPLKKVNGSVFF